MTGRDHAESRDSIDGWRRWIDAAGVTAVARTAGRAATAARRRLRDAYSTSVTRRMLSGTEQSIVASRTWLWLTRGPAGRPVTEVDLTETRTIGPLLEILASAGGYLRKTGFGRVGLRWERRCRERFHDAPIRATSVLLLVLTTASLLGESPSPRGPAFGWYLIAWGTAVPGLSVRLSSDALANHPVVRRLLTVVVPRSRPSTMGNATETPDTEPDAADQRAQGPR